MDTKEKVIEAVKAITDENVLLLLYTFISAVVSDPDTVRALRLLSSD